MLINGVKQTCKDCLYWVFVRQFADDEPGLGDCRRKSPTKDSNSWSSYPITADDHWCGEFTRREQDENCNTSKQG